MCLGSVGELRKKIKSLLQTGRQFCLVRSTRVDVIRGQGNRTTSVMPIVAIR